MPVKYKNSYIVAVMSEWLTMIYTNTWGAVLSMVTVATMVKVV